MIDLPARPGVGPNAMAEFNAISRTLIDEWERRKKLRGQLPPAESANGYLKRESYRIIVHYISHDRARFFEGVIRRDGRGLTARVKLEENPFHLEENLFHLEENSLHLEENLKNVEENLFF